MYSIKVQITPGLQLMEQASFSGCNISSYLDEDFRQRYKLNGSVTFWGSSAKSIINTDGVFLYCEVYLDSDLIYTGQLSKAGKIVINENVVDFDIIQDDNYTELLQHISDKQTQGASTSAEYNYETYLVSIYQGVTKTGTPVIPPDYKLCHTYIGVSLPSWDINKAYLGAMVITTDSVWNANSLEDTYCSYNNIGYVAVSNTKGEEPGTGPSWVVIFEVLEYSQERSIFQIDGFTQSISGLYWYNAGCTIRVISEILLCIDIFESLKIALGHFGYSIIKDNYLKYIQDNYPDQFNIVAYYPKALLETGRVSDKEASIKDYIDIYEFLFNVHWRLEGKELIFKHPSELHLSVPTPIEGNEQYYIDRVFSMDWSNSEFSFSLRDKIYREDFTVGDSPNKDYSDVKIVYDNTYIDTAKYELKQAELDIAYGLTTEAKAEKIIMATTNSIVTIDALKLINLITGHYTDGRPYGKGEINGIEYQFTRLANEECTINIPYNRQDLLNFDNLIKSSFGNLQVTELQVNMESQSATIKAGK